MAHPVVLRVAKHSSWRSLQGVARHQWREIDTPNADPARTPANEDWRPVVGSDALLAAVEERIATVTEKVPERSVLALEYVITANHRAFREHGGEVDSTAYFRDALAWLERKHGAENVVAVNIQRDELAPHLVAFVVPLREVEAKTRKRSVIAGTNPDGTKRRETRLEHQPAGVRLSASHFVDGPAKLATMQTEFARDVGQRHGLERGIEGSRATHQTVKQHYAALQREAAKTPPIDVPEPGIADRVNVSGYGVRVAQAVIDQVEPERAALAARAATAEADRRRAEEMARTAAQARSELAKATTNAAALEKELEPYRALYRRAPDALRALYTQVMTAARGAREKDPATPAPARRPQRGPER